SPYAVSKLAAEYYVRTIGTLVGIETVSLRVFNAYGPGQPLPAVHAPVIPRFIRQALTGGSLVVHGNGSQTRDYVFLDDVVDALIAAATAQQLDRLVINVGSGQEVSGRELVSAVATATGRTLEPLYTKSDEGGVSRMCADLTLAAEKLNFRPKVALADGLRLTLERDPRFVALSLGTA
ncbi:MAG: NAD-dependent epimerase/dehydratase family protein, partial [Anaerolineales bacterium]